MAAVRVLLVDDHPVVRTGLRGMLAGRPDIEIVGEAAGGDEAAAQVQALRPDVVLMDLRMPGGDGVGATRRVRELCPQARVLVMTMYDSDADILRAIEAGATGYLLKGASGDELHRAVLATAQGRAHLSPEVAARLMRRAAGPVEEPLTRREIEVLRQVAAGRSNREIAAACGIGEATVRTHLLHAFAKLGVTGRTAAVTEALRRGLLDL